jgi:phospholipid/cholesterol/gamma-HCH transport system permease protein
VIGQIGRQSLSPVKFILNSFLLSYVSARAFFFSETRGVYAVIQVVAQQIYFTGFQALPLITVLSLATGCLVTLQSLGQFALGGQAMIGNLLVAVVLRELAPLMTALVVVARSGTAVASELGNMKVNREIEALEVMGIHPLSYVVFPRLVGGVVSLICLGIYFAFISFAGGFLITQVFGTLSLDHFLEQLASAISLRDVLFFGFKIFVAGVLVFSICCFYGMSVGRGSYEVPQVTTKAVVQSLLAVTTFQLMFSLIFYLIKLSDTGIL